MPLARIDLIKGKSVEYRQTIGDAVYGAMVEILKAPKDDRFQVITEHDGANFVYDPHFFGVDRSKDLDLYPVDVGRGSDRRTKARVLQGGR